jgi:histidyl-tRNA synthetase
MLNASAYRGTGHAVRKVGCLQSFRLFSGSEIPISSSSTAKRGRVSVAVIQDKDIQNGSKQGKGGIATLAPPKGTRDFYPEDQRLKNWMFNIWRDTARRYSFEEYDAPVVEHVELYIRKAGEEVTEQLYDFEDKGGRHLSLRPEMTPSLARMVLAKKNTLPFPLKWFSIPQCWRYERMTRGRRREHYQWNMDIFGIQGIEAEAELLSSIIFSFRQMGLSHQDVGIKINSRKLLNDLMSSVGKCIFLNIF